MEDESHTGDTGCSGEEQADVLRQWITGEPAKTLVLKRLAERIASAAEGTMETLVVECSREAVLRIHQKEFPQPPDWLHALCDLLNLARAWDSQQVLANPAKRRIFNAMLSAVVANLEGKPCNVAAATLQAVERELNHPGSGLD